MIWKSPIWTAVVPTCWERMSSWSTKLRPDYKASNWTKSVASPTSSAQYWTQVKRSRNGKSGKAIKSGCSLFIISNPTAWYSESYRIFGNLMSVKNGCWKKPRKWYANIWLATSCTVAIYLRTTSGSGLPARWKCSFYRCYPTVDYGGGGKGKKLKARSKMGGRKKVGGEKDGGTSL